MQAHRLMRRNGTGTIVKVFAIALTRNFWEYYFLEPLTKRQPTALVMGFVTEMGAVDLEEIQPFVTAVARGVELNDLAPCEGWEWVS